MSLTDSLRFDMVDHVLLVVHADVPPADADWQRLITVRDANKHRLRGGLVVAPPRANLSATQRADVSRFMRETGASTAVVTDSALIRGVAAAVALLGVKVRAFAPRELAAALDYLAVAVGKRDELIRRIECWQTQLARSA